jgi:hypothetical protein
MCKSSKKFISQIFFITNFIVRQINSQNKFDVLNDIQKDPATMLKIID